MTVLAVARAASTSLGLSRPQAVFTDTSREMIEMRDALNAAGRAIAFDRYDWQRLKRFGTVTGDGTSQALDLPEDYLRLPKTAEIFPVGNPYGKLRHIVDSNRWLELEQTGFGMADGMWTLLGGQMHIRPVLGSGAQVRFVYVTRNYAQGSSGAAKDAFTADTDTFVLPERLLTLGVIAQWKKNKGLDSADAIDEFEDALAAEIGADKGPSTIAVGTPRFPGNVSTAYPRPL